MDNLNQPTKIIKAALMSGITLTTAQGNQLARTVDFRKVISRLRRKGMPIRDYWKQSAGRRFKVYYMEHLEDGYWREFQA